MIVVDASVVFKWLNPSEPLSDKALELYEKHRQKQEEIIVPTLLFTEIANALATKSHTSQKLMIDSIRFLYNSELVVYDETEEDILEAALLARKHKTSVYDMLYAVIAKKRKVSLITADGKFVGRVRFPFVKKLTS